MWHTAVAYAQDTGDAAASPGMSGLAGQLPFFIMIGAIFYFLLIRPQQKRERQRREMLAALDKGDKVITSGGIYGTIIHLNEKTVVLKVADDPTIKLEFARGAVSQVAHEEEVTQ